MDHQLTFYATKLVLTGPQAMRTTTPSVTINGYQAGSGGGASSIHTASSCSGGNKITSAVSVSGGSYTFYFKVPNVTADLIFTADD